MLDQELIIFYEGAENMIQSLIVKNQKLMIENKELRKRVEENARKETSSN